MQTRRALLEGANRVEEAIEADSFPAVARGQRPTGAASGFHTSVLAGIAALNFGAGEPEIAHTQGEFVTRQAVDGCYAVLAQFLGVR